MLVLPKLHRCKTSSASETRRRDYESNRGCGLPRIASPSAICCFKTSSGERWRQALKIRGVAVPETNDALCEQGGLRHSPWSCPRGRSLVNPSSGHRLHRSHRACHPSCRYLSASVLGSSASIIPRPTMMISTPFSRMTRRGVL